MNRCVNAAIRRNSGKISLRSTIAMTDTICAGAAASYIDGGRNIQFSTIPNCFETIPNLDPVLDLNGLQNNGGPTQTIAIRANSPAINVIGIRNCTTPDGKRVFTDQRLLSRPTLPLKRCDIGAYEAHWVGFGLSHVGKYFDVPKTVRRQ